MLILKNYSVFLRCKTVLITERLKIVTKGQKTVPEQPSKRIERAQHASQLHPFFPSQQPSDTSWFKKNVISFTLEINC